MTSEKLMIKNWNRYQHYKDRRPPWIKLATDTFQDYDFSRLQDGSKLLLIAIWTIASRTNDGTIPNDFIFIKKESHLGKSVKLSNFEELIAFGFLFSASNMLADCKQSATPETETEAERETEKRQDASFCAGYVLEKLPWTGRGARWAYEEQLAKVQKATGARMQDLAELMVKRWTDYDTPDRKFKSGVKTFITTGLWAQPEKWNAENSGNSAKGADLDQAFARAAAKVGAADGGAS